MIEPIQNLNGICEKTQRGIYKRWLFQNKTDYSKMCDYMQKINFSIQDLNNEISQLTNLSMKSIIYVIILVVWIQEAVEKIEKLYRKDVMRHFSYTKEQELTNASKFIKAIRSFAVAHPLSTDRHPRFGFDGNYICVDIRTFQRDLTAAFIKADYICQLDFNGLQENGNKNCDFYFYVYSDKDDGMKLFHYIGCNFEDIFYVAKLYIDKLYVLDKYLRKLKLNDYR